MGLGITGSYVRRLERRQRTESITQDGYAFTLHPTCPPSTSLTFTGGFAWQVEGYLIQYGWYIPSYTVDLTDPDKVSVRNGFATYTYTFTNPYWYAPCLFVISNRLYAPEPPEEWPDEIADYRIYLYGRIGVEPTPPYLTEYETAAEAEDASRLLIGDAAGAEGVVAGCIILRNNGNVTSHNQYEPVDMVNRGRSYLFGGKRYGWSMG